MADVLEELTVLDLRAIVRRAREPGFHTLTQCVVPDCKLGARSPFFVCGSCAERELSRRSLKFS